MSRVYHRLYRDHLITSKEWVYKERPCLINNWEATYFDFTTDKLYDIASTASDLGVKMFVMDDGWFGAKHPRVDDNAGLGDWVVNPERFPDGLGPFVERVNELANDKGEGMKFGLWVGPSLLSPDDVCSPGCVGTLRLMGSRWNLRWSTPNPSCTRLTQTGSFTRPSEPGPNNVDSSSSTWP